MIEFQKSEEEMRKGLPPELYRIARDKGTEAPFTGRYHDSKEKGMYKCAVCGAELFSSDTKFDSGTGWPSFTQPANLENVELKEDRSLGTRLPAPEGAADGGQVVRTEVLCKKCGSHLGHVFDDGPGPTGKRYCINSVCLDLEKKNDQKDKG